MFQLFNFKLFNFHVNFLWLTLMIICFKFGMSLWSCFTFSVSVLTTVTRHNMLFLCFWDGSRFFKGPAGIVFQAFEAFRWVCILLELEMISFLRKFFKLSFKIAEIAHLLRMFSCFYPHIGNLGIRSSAIWQVLTVNQKIVFDQCSEQMRPLSKFISVAFS